MVHLQGNEWKMMTEAEIFELLNKFVQERDWEQFHTPENLAKSVSIEAAELLECFQWTTPDEWADVESELADVLTYAYLLCRAINRSPAELILTKLEETRSKYPVESSKGKSTKYDRL